MSVNPSVAAGSPAATAIESDFFKLRVARKEAVAHDILSLIHI